MPKGLPVTPEETARRIKTCRECVTNDLGTKHAADRLGMKVTTLSQWLVDNGYTTLRAKLGENSYALMWQVLLPTEIKRRLVQRALDEALGLPVKTTAISLQLEYPAFWKWLREYCGADSAVVALDELD